MIRPGDLADALEAGIRLATSELDVEQAVRGLDAMDELALHPVLAASLVAAGYGVHREQRYPGDRGKPLRSHGERCDLVVTPDGRPLRGPDDVPTLFDPADAVALDDAFWLEIKVVHQHTIEGPPSGYGGQLLTTTSADVVKLARDRGILHAGLVIVLFAESRLVVEHDLDIWLDRAITRGLPVMAPSLRCVDINERIGNAVCGIALYPVARL